MGQDWEHYGSDEMVKYGNLFVAAPDLLEACEEVQQVLAKWAATWSGRPTKEDCAGLKTIMDAAIAKAKGKKAQHG